MIQIKKGDLLLVTDSLVCHQCNTTSKKSAGLAYTIFNECVECDTYSGEYAKSRKVGTIDVFYEICNMYAQRHPGRPNFTDDTREMRLNWFKQCLLAVSKNRDVTSISIPYKIGSSLAGGKWVDYLDALLAFDEYLISQDKEIDIVIYKYEV